MMKNVSYAGESVVDTAPGLASITRRLEDGEARIQAAVARGENVTAWEDFWLRLLNEYETLHDRMSGASEAEQSRIAA